MARSRGRAFTRAAGLVAGAVLVAGCTGTPGAPDPGRPSPTPGDSRPRAVSSPRATPRPTPGPTPTPLPLPPLDLAAPSVWFGPNMGSLDFPDLFTSPDRWATARAEVDVLQFYANALSGDPFDIGGDNVLDTFVGVDAFGRLHDWGIAIAVEAGVIKWFACDHASWAAYTNRAIDNVEANGGRVSVVAMDEPLLGSVIVEQGTGCGLSTADAAAEVARYMAAVRSEHPDVAIGTIETVPPQTVDEVDAWIAALQAADATPAFLHLDVEVADGIADPAFAADIARLRDSVEDRGVPFGLILTADWQVATSDRTYADSVLTWARAIGERIGRPTHVIFQSWMGPAPSGRHELPVNLPDGPGAASHTRLIVDGLAALGPPDP